MPFLRIVSFHRIAILIVFLITALLLACSATNIRPTNNYIVLRNDRPLKEQIRFKYASYIINSRLNLKGNILTLPEGSLLIFEKYGSIVNGTIIGNKTQIQAPKRAIFENILIDRKGTWLNGISYPEWFGACNNISFDSKISIQYAVDIADTCLLTQDYYMSYNTPTNRGDDKSICAIELVNKVLLGKNGNMIHINAKHSNTERTSVLWLGNNVTVDGVNIDYFNTDFSGWTGTQAGVYRVMGGNVTIQNTSLRGAMAAWINLIGGENRQGYLIRNNYVHDCDCGLIIQGSSHETGKLYHLGLRMEGNVIEKEFVRHSEFVSFWGCAKGGGLIYYTDVSILNNKFVGGWQGGCISGHPTRNGLKNVIIKGNRFDDCGACSFYNVDGLTYVDNQVVGSTFLKRYIKGQKGSYPHLCFFNCKNCKIEDNSCFGLVIKNCNNLKIGRLKQTLCLKANDPYLKQKPVFVTNYMSPKIENSTVEIDELVVNPFMDDEMTSDLCRYYVYDIKDAKVKVKKTISNVPIQMSTKNFSTGIRYFKIKDKTKSLFIDTTKN